MLKKFTSRKFLVSLAGVIVGIALVFGIDTGAVTEIAGIVTTLASIVVYIITEGRIDKAAVTEINQEAKDESSD